jgi:hypothetical protein
MNPFYFAKRKLQLVPAATGFYFDPNNVAHGFVREADRGALGLAKFNGQ